jgi:glycerophosphoryl diester phosphodiesterase
MIRTLVFIFSILLFASCFSSKKSTMTATTLPYPIDFDWQGHRGCRGLMPENTIPAFLKALSYPVTTLELDLAVSKNGDLIISHEPWMSHHICTKPDGNPVTEKEEKDLKLMEMTYAKIKQFDCGLRGNKRFPKQQKSAVHKPSFKDMVTAVDEFCLKTIRSKPNYNIEIKSHPDGYEKYMPQPEIFVDFVLQEVKDLKIRKRVCIQSFDPNVMNTLIKKDDNITNAFLVENKEGIDNNLKKLTFKPDIYSPDFQLLTKESVDSLHAMDIKVIPWTVNKLKDMKRLISWGVDGIITDYPNLINEL